MSQFFFKMKHKGKEIEVSFNIDKIVSTELLEDGRLIVKLDDWREEMREFEQPSKNGKGVMRISKKVPVSTELVLQPEDAKKLKSTTDINSWEWDGVGGEKSAEEIHKEEIEKFIKEEIREEVKEELQEEEMKEEDFKVE